MKKMLLVGAALAASLAIAGCNRAATTNNAAAPANKAAPANTAAPAGNSAGGNSAAGSEAPTLNFTNQSGQAIITLQVSPTGENSWGEDILGRDVLPNGETTQIVFAHDEDRCFWDFRATYEGGGETDNRNVNLCESGGSVTMLPPQ